MLQLKLQSEWKKSLKMTRLMRPQQWDGGIRSAGLFLKLKKNQFKKINLKKNYF